MIKKSILLILLTVIVPLKAQQQLAFSFLESPQTLMLNPGAETNFSSHYGVPILSNVNISFGNTGFQMRDLFLNDSRDFNLKFKEVLTKIDARDYFQTSAVIDVINGGFRINNKTYVSFGFYEEMDVIFYMPKDLIELMYYGNEPFLDRTFSFSQLSMKADFLGVLHAGVSKKINEKLTLGARVKIYSSGFNIESTNNSGTLTTFKNSENILRQSLSNFDVELRTSGVEGEILSSTFLGNNLGLGLDLGLTYHFTPQLEFTGSILDVGFIKHSKGTKNFSSKGDYIFDGINLEFPDSGPLIDYWREFKDDFDTKVPRQEDQESYSSWRPMKLNAALKYSFGEKRSKSCYAKTHKQYYYNSIGFQIHTIMRPLRPQFSFTSFYEMSLSKKIHTKFTHTMNDYSAAIFGAGLSLQVSKVNLYGLLDNILGVADLSSINNISINFGMNIIID